MIEPEPAAVAVREAEILPAPVRRRHNARPRNFEAASADRLNNDWIVNQVNINDLLKAQLPTLRARARHLARNSDYASRFVGLMSSNVVGHLGVRVQSKVANQRGGPDLLASAAIEEHFNYWAENHCDFFGKANFIDQQNLTMATFARDGEFLVRKVVGAEAGPYGFQLQAIDMDRLDCGFNVDLGGYRFIRMGIEYDPVGRPVAYHISNNPTPDTYLALNGQQYLRVPADQMIHGFIQTEVGQGRGIPPMTASMLRMNQLQKYEQAALVNARIGASSMGFFTQTEEGGLGTDDPGDDGFIYEVEPGVFKKLPVGVDFKQFDSQYPNGEFAVFVKAGLRGVAAGLGVAYHSLTGDLESTSYSSGRLGELDQRAVWMALQGWFTRAYVQQAFNGWLREALIRQIIVVRGRPLSLVNEAKYQAVSYRCKRWPWVDPLKDAMASEKQIAMRVRSRSAIIRDLGDEPEEVWQEIARENETMDRLGIPAPVEKSAAKGVVANADQNGNPGDSGSGQA